MISGDEVRAVLNKFYWLLFSAVCLAFGIGVLMAACGLLVLR